MANLNETQIKAAYLLVENANNITKTAQDLGVSRTAIYSWLKIPEFQELVNNQEHELILKCKKEFSKRLPMAIEEYWKICTNAKDLRVKEAALSKWIDRAMGKVTTTVAMEKPEDQGNDTDFDLSEALKEVKAFNSNVIQLEKKAK